MKAQFISVLAKFEGNIWGTYLEVPDAVIQPFLKAGIKRIRCSINESKPIHCALLSMGNGRWFITVNKLFCKENHLQIEDKLQVEIEKDTSKYGMEMPRELDEMLKQDGEASAYFEELTPGKQRNLIHFVATIKSSEIRIRRALVVANHLTSHKGLIDFKDLNQEIKEANNLHRF